MLLLYYKPYKSEFRCAFVEIMNKKIEYFNCKIKQAETTLARNAFSSNWSQIKDSVNSIRKDDENYGVSINEKTIIRGKQAHEHVYKEIHELCEIIKENGSVKYDEATYEKYFEIKFGKLFSLYANISNKLVGILLRARKYGILTFNGEILYQGKDDESMIKLFKF